MRSYCLVSLFEGGDAIENPDGYASSITVHDLAAGAACCASSKTSCAHCCTLPHAQLTCASQQVTPCAALRRGNSIAAYTLLDRGSGTEAVTGSVCYGNSGAA